MLYYLLTHLYSVVRGLEGGDGGQGLAGAVRRSLARRPLAGAQGRAVRLEIAPEN